jgi:hypothetical protein
MRLLRVTLVAWTVLVPIASPSAQGVNRIADADMRAALKASDESDSRGGLFNVARDNNAQFVLNRRIAPSALELHCFWDDLLVVRSGLGVLRHGRKVRGLVRYGAGEWRGTSLADANEVTVASGDVIRVPAGEAHSIAPLGEAPLVYLVVKVRSFEERACGSLSKRGQ